MCPSFSDFQVFEITFLLCTLGKCSLQLISFEMVFWGFFISIFVVFFHRHFSIILSQLFLKDFFTGISGRIYLCWFYKYHIQSEGRSSSAWVIKGYYVIITLIARWHQENLTYLFLLARIGPNLVSREIRKLFSINKNSAYLIYNNDVKTDFKDLTTGLNKLHTRTSVSENLSLRKFSIWQRFLEGATERYSKKKCY